MNMITVFITRIIMLRCKCILMDENLINKMQKTYIFDEPGVISKIQVVIHDRNFRQWFVGYKNMSTK